MKFKAISLTFALVAVAYCAANDECELPDVIQRLKLESMERAVKSAESSIKILEEIETLVPTGGDPDVPIRDSMTGEESDAFSKLGQRQQNSMLIQLMESRRQRDLDVIFELTLTASDRQAGRTPVGDEDKRSLHHAILDSLEEYIPDPNPSKFKGDSLCNLDIVLFELQMQTLKWLNSTTTSVEDLHNKMLRAYEKYGISPTEDIAPSELPVALRQKLEYIGEVELAPLYWASRYIQDMERIRILASGSELMLKNNMQDILYSGGDIKSLGSTSEEQAVKGEIDEDIVIAIGIWSVINESIPADMVESLGDSFSPDGG